MLEARAVVARRKERTSTDQHGSSFVFHRWTTRLRSLSHPATSRRAPARRRASTHPTCPDGNGTPRTPPAASVGEPRRPGPPARLSKPRRFPHAGSAARAVLQPQLWPTGGTRCHLRRAADAAGRERGRASPARPAGTPRPASPTPARRKRRWPRHAARSCSGTQGSTGGVSGPARIVVRSEDGREPWDACFASPWPIHDGSRTPCAAGGATAYLTCAEADGCSAAHHRRCGS